eukprot:CAMPEP_0183299210 /NCGR_PEP_ID=MMETSP0160_2-20130417/6007_1 /TAXON_ID=2839 ORGANISM="Odontella Sinensis, Strain Grunow 1884" /NCGR_SAMPLE_ID=MMETSP0160_2 /ASSEMBLY_ACC=CAM_ASM_000250 /LENGTH=581 /DNA_ID=CAMNT_0025461409 /DNA_START=96 /DNA_END=1841 /DNA_ORIENTATION=+
MADANRLFVLHETAAGFALFEVVQFEEIAALTDKANDAVSDFGRFGRSVKLTAFRPFESAVEALENCNAVSEHAMTDLVRDFLESSLPKVSKKKSKATFSLGVVDPGFATAICDGVPGMSCRSDDTVREILRGCRLHLSKYVKGLEGGAENQAQLGLGHSYSRGKVKFNPARSDNMIIQSIALLDQMDKDLNTFAMRVREWYSWHFPELRDHVKDNYMYARCAAYIQDKASLWAATATAAATGEDSEEGGATDKEDKLPGLIEITGDEEVAKAVAAAARTSMGMDCSAVDMVNIVNFTQRMVKLAEFRKQLAGYLQDKMSVVAPNLSALIGDTVAARLISKAGSLTNLAKAPASTVQILGAEKALFRALKTKGNTPKYGLIYHSTFIGRADSKNKGRISRYLANKCSIATRIDSFADEPTSAYGEKLREQVEERLKFYETGAAPRKNLDVMQEVARHLAAGKDGGDDAAPSTDKKKRKRDKDGGDDDDDVEMEDAAAETPKKKKKSKKDKKKEGGEDAMEEEEDDGFKTPSSKKDKKKDKSSKKKKRKEDKDDDDDEDVPKTPSTEKSKKDKKKKKKKSKD